MRQGLLEREIREEYIATSSLPREQLFHSTSVLLDVFRYCAIQCKL